MWKHFIKKYILESEYTMCICKFFLKKIIVPYKKYDIISTLKPLCVPLPSIAIPPTLVTFLIFLKSFKI